MRICQNPSLQMLSELQVLLERDCEREIAEIRVEPTELYSVFYLTAAQGGSVIGGASVLVFSHAAEVHKIYVAPLWRRKGVGRALFCEAVQMLKSRGINEVYIETISVAGLGLLSAVASDRDASLIDGDKHILSI